VLKFLAICGVVGIIVLILDIDTKKHIRTGADAVKSGADATEKVLTGDALK